MSTLTLVNPRHRVTPAMLDTLSVMRPSGAVMSVEQIAEERWPEHECWRCGGQLKKNVLCGLMCTLRRLARDYMLYEVRKGHFVITRHGCKTIDVYPGFPADHHIGDYYEVMLDILADAPTSPSGWAALESLHFWATVHGGDLPGKPKRARRVNRQAVILLCDIPQIQQAGTACIAAARTIFEFCERLQPRRALGSPKPDWNEPLYLPLRNAWAHSSISWTARQLLAGALVSIVSDTAMHRDDLREVLVAAPRHLSTSSWGMKWNLLQGEL